MKSIVSFLLLCIAGLAPCQPADEQKAFEVTAQSKIDQALVAYKAKNYSKAVALTEEITSAYVSLPADAKKQEALNAANIYYSLACFACLNRDPSKALASINTAAGLGFKDYRTLNNERDLDAIRIRPEFKSLLARLRPFGDHPYILRNAGAYKPEPTLNVRFEYESPSDDRLKLIRQKYNLDAVAGLGDDVSKVLRLMRWVHLSVQDDGRNWPQVPMNADDLISWSSKAHQGINCRCMSITLNDCYLAMGFKSRVVTCLPRDPKDPDCHVIVNVFVPSLRKWVWMDSSFCGYMKDEKGTLLGIQEVRDRVLHGKPVFPSQELDFNGQPYAPADYLDYMTKNMYWFSIAVRSESNYETKGTGKRLCYVHLLPSGFQPTLKGWPLKDPLVSNIYTSDPNVFWKTP